MKRASILFLVFIVLCACNPALAAGSSRDAPCPLGCPHCGCSRDCASCSLCQAVFFTARPVPAYTSAPEPSAVPKPAIPTAPKPSAAPMAKPTAGSSVSTGDYTTISVAAQEQNVLNLLNQDRAKNGLPALSLDAELSRLARMKSCDMKENRYFAHESPTWGNAATMLTAFGYSFQGVGENIAHHATVEKAEAAFTSSAGHRANILGRQWSRVGIGVCVDDSGFVYVTQLFVR